MKIIFQNISKRFGEIEVLKDITFEIRESEFFFLLGPSGCGKTTLLRIVAGFEMPTSGKIYFGEKNVEGLPPEKRNVGMVFQNYALWPHMTVYENIAYGLKIKKLERDEIEKRVNDILDFVQLSEFRDRYPSQLSGGQQQRVAVARSLVIKPGVLLFDEPLSNLDAKLRIDMRREIKKIQRKTGITSIYVTHDQKEALSMADYLVILNDGKIEQKGKPHEIYNFPANKFVASFIGEINFIDGNVNKQNDKETLVTTKIGNISGISSRKFEKSENVVASIRPQHVKIIEDDDTRENTFKGEITDIVFMGEYVQYTVKIDDFEINIMDFEKRYEILKVGDKIKIHLPYDKVLILKNE